MRITFFKIPQHRKFRYDPIYFNPEKEEREERLRRIKKEMGVEAEEQSDESGYKERIRGGMRGRIKSHFEVGRSERKKSNLRLVIILILLMAAFYYLLNAASEWYSQYLM